MVTGAAVRLTGSGLGCPDWPTCEEEQLVAPLEYHAIIEFGNRLVTGLVSIAVVLAVLGSVWVRYPQGTNRGASRRSSDTQPGDPPPANPAEARAADTQPSRAADTQPSRRADLIWWSLGLVAGVGGQVILGRWVVTSHLAPWIVISHFLLSMVLLWNAVVLHHRAKMPTHQPRTLLRPNLPHSAWFGGLAWLMSLTAVWVIVSGTIVTGSGPHGGDEEAERLSFDITNVARLHAVGVIVLVSVVVVLLWMSYRGAQSGAGREPISSRATNGGATNREATTRNTAPRNELLPIQKALGTLLVILLIQGAVGYVQYLTDVPVLLVGIHVVGSISVWWAVLHAHLSLSVERAANKI